jgi:CheY-like chemotaxis protein
VAESAAGGDGARPVVLLVDDDAAIRRTMTVGLGLEGFDVVCASGGRPALEAVGTVRPAVMLLDLTMPDLDGLEVLRRLRAAGDDLPVCVLSARDQVVDRVRGLEEGADDYVVKPFALEEVSARLHALLRRRPPRETERLVAGDIELDPAGFSAPPAAAGATSSSPGASSSCCTSSCATPASCSTAGACTRRSGATPSTPARTSRTYSSATCGASSRRAASPACCTRCAASGSSSGPELCAGCAGA